MHACKRFQRPEKAEKLVDFYMRRSTSVIWGYLPKYGKEEKNFPFKGTFQNNSYFRVFLFFFK